MLDVNLLFGQFSTKLYENRRNWPCDSRKSANAWGVWQIFTCIENRWVFKRHPSIISVLLLKLKSNPSTPHRQPPILFLHSFSLPFWYVVLHKYLYSSGLFTHLGPDCSFFLVLTGDINEDDDDADSWQQEPKHHANLMRLKWPNN